MEPIIKQFFFSGNVLVDVQDCTGHVPPNPVKLHIAGQLTHFRVSYFDQKNFLTIYQQVVP